MKTVRVRIAVAVCPNGCWSSNGNKLMPDWDADARSDKSHAKAAACYVFDEHGEGQVVFIEADVPVPDGPPPIVTIRGDLVAAAPREGEGTQE